MSLFIHHFFEDGFLDTLSEVRILQHCGQWTRARRACWLKQALTYREGLIHHTHSTFSYTRAYYAGRIAALKSRVTAQFSKQPASFEKKPEYAPLLSYVEAHRQERLREATVYTCASGWDWDDTPEDELDLIEQEMMLLQQHPEIARFAFQFAVRWLCIGTLFILVFPSVPVYLLPCLLISSASLAFPALP